MDTTKLNSSHILRMDLYCTYVIRWEGMLATKALKSHTVLESCIFMLCLALSAVLAYFPFEKIKGGLWDHFAVYAFRLVARQRLGEDVPAATNTHIEHLVFYAVRVVSKERRRLILHRTSCYISFLFYVSLENAVSPRLADGNGNSYSTVAL
jgi:hypothetical protein